MRFEATKSDLIAEARAALAAADRELRGIHRPRPRVQPPGMAQPPGAAAPQRRDREEALARLEAELASIDASTLDRARDEMEAAIERYVTACTVYNRILAEIRQHLREIGGVSDDDINYRSESGQAGLRINDVIRLQALPWQTVSHVALNALRTHAPVEHMSLDTPHDPDLDDLSPAPPAAEEPEPQPERPLEAALEEAEEPVEQQPAIDQEQIEALFDDMIAPVLAFIRDQQAEIVQLRERLDTQSQELEQLREQAQRQAAAAERVSAYFDALREAQERLR